MISNKISQHQSVNLEMDAWFDDIIAQIKTDKFQLETQTASKDKVELYNNLFENNPDKIFTKFNNDYRMYFISKVVVEYINELIVSLKVSIKEIKIALDFSNNKLLVWAVIPTENEDFFEKKLILTEAKINAKYIDKGFCISSTIVTVEDNLSIPEQYKLLTN